MKCPKCEELGLKSKVYVGASMTTAMCVTQYYDENGVLHIDDPNIRETKYYCSNRHNFLAITKSGATSIRIEDDSPELTIMQLPNLGLFY